MEDLISFLSVAQYIFIPLDIVLTAAFIFVLLRALEFRPDLQLTKRRSRVITLEKAQIMESWNAIQDKMKERSASMARLAIIDADKLIDSILKKAEIGGEHMADRLDRISTEDYPSIQAVWRAHRLRNELVHSPDFEINPSDAEQALRAYESFLKEIAIL